MSKSYLRKTKASGSTIRRVEMILARGWYRKPKPGPTLAPGFRAWRRLQESGVAI